MVLGALLLGIIVLFVSCSGGDSDDKRGQGQSTQAPTPGPASSTPDEEPSFSDAEPGAGPPLPDPSQLQSQQPGDGTGTGTATTPVTPNPNVNVTAPAPGSGGACTDAEVAVTPVPAATTVKRGVPLEIKLKIKNISARTCARDVGADLQELYIEQGVQKIWSSDTCGNSHGSDVKQLPPGGELGYSVTWNGRMATRCSGGLAAGPVPAAGVYQVRARLGAKVSDPVTLTVAA